MTLVGHLGGIDGERATFAADLHANLRRADTVAAELSKQIDGHIERNGIDAPAPAPDNTDEYEGTDGFEQPILETLDLRDRGISTVIWAGGFTRDFSWIHAPVFDRRRLPDHRRRRHAPSPGSPSSGSHSSRAFGRRCSRASAMMRQW